MLLSLYRDVRRKMELLCVSHSSQLIITEDGRECVERCFNSLCGSLEYPTRELKLYRCWTQRIPYIVMYY